MDLYCDLNVNLTSDSKRGLSGFKYNAFNLPVEMTNGTGQDIYYTYGSGDQRIFKRESGGTLRNYYLRDAAGKTLVIRDYVDETWIYELYGNDLVAEWVDYDSIAYDSSNQQRLGRFDPDLNPEDGPGKKKMSLMKIVSTALPVIVPSVLPVLEGAALPVLPIALFVAPVLADLVQHELSKEKMLSRLLILYT